MMMLQLPQGNSSFSAIPSVIFDQKTGKSWLVSHQIGKGGFSQVYQVVDRGNSMNYAVKIVPKTFLSTHEHLFSKLRSEIAIHSSLRHKNIVEFVCCFEDSQNFYLVLELCSNGTLLEMLQRKKRLSQRQVQKFASGALDALEHLHAQRIIHRDVKPGNLFLDAKLQVKLGDFGLSVKVAPGERKKTLCGTPNYIAPEVITKEGYSFEVDVWSLGIVLYTLLVGKAPFTCASGTSDELCKVILQGNIEYPMEVLSSSAISLLKGMLQKDPLKRITLKQMREHAFFANNSPSMLLVEGKENVENEKQDKFAIKSNESLQNQSKNNMKKIPLKPEIPPIRISSLSSNEFQQSNAQKQSSNSIDQVAGKLNGKYFNSSTNQKPTEKSILLAPPSSKSTNILQPISESLKSSNIQCLLSEDSSKIPHIQSPKSNLIQCIAHNLSLFLADCKSSIKNPNQHFSKCNLPCHIIKLLPFPKYGIFYRISNSASSGNAGAFFNDHTAMFIDYSLHQCAYYSRIGNSKFESFTFSNALDQIPTDLHKKYQILTRISQSSSFISSNSVIPCSSASTSLKSSSPLEKNNIIIKDKQNSHQSSLGDDYPDVILKVLQPLNDSGLLLVRTKNKTLQAFFHQSKTVYLFLDEGRWLTAFKDDLFFFNGPLREYSPIPSLPHSKGESESDLHRIYKALI